MKVKVENLIQPLSIKIAGDEDWLKKIYEDFRNVPEGAPSGVGKSPITGEFLLTKETAGFVRVKGKIVFKPFVDCSRCAEEIPWDIDQDINVVYRPSNELKVFHKEHSLSREELDHYYIEGGVIDLEALVNEWIQMAIPMQTVPACTGDGHCSLCKRDMSEERVYGTPDDDDANPFAVLKQLRQ